MTGAFRSIIGLLAAVTVPICLLLAGAAAPIIHVVYGQVWAPAAPVLTWLAILAAFRILFELAYDYLVVLGRSHIIFTIQVIWLVVLIPGLLLGASMWGLPGLAGVQVYIAALVVVPLYLWEFRKSGLKVGVVGRRTRVPIAAGIFVGFIAAVIASLAGSQLVACLASGAVCLVVVGLLLFHDRTELSAVRRLDMA